MNKDKISGFVFLFFSIAYGFAANRIPKLVGEDMDFLTPRSFPLALAVLCGIFSLLLILKSGVKTFSDESDIPVANWKKLDWKLTIYLLILMLFYGFLLSPLGFLLATWIFLISGFYLMGERRLKVLLLVSTPLVLSFWFLLAYVLDVYLEAGTLWN